MAENMHFDELHRVIYKIVRKIGYTEEWWYKYDSQGNRTVIKHIKEKKPF